MLSREKKTIREHRLQAVRIKTVSVDKKLVGLVVSFLTFFISASFCHSQDKPDTLLRNSAIRIYVDCSRCDIDFIRKEIAFVNYVRDRQEAGVHVLVTTQPTGSGGTEYTLTFIGQQEYAGLNDTLKFFSKQTDTEEIVRNGLVRVLKLGLMRYVNKTPLAEQISISFSQPTEPTAVVDKWNNWVFRVNANGYFNGEKSRNSVSLFGSLSVNRVTPDLKINLSVNGNYNENNFKIDGEEISSFSRGKKLEGTTVFALTGHWSVATGSSFSSSTFSNTKLNAVLETGLEYNLFPYSLSTRKQLRIQYIPAYSYFEYNEETIFDKNFDRLFKENLSIALELKETWGSVSATLEGSNYLRDFKKNRLELFGEFSLRLIKGLSLNLFGNGSMIHDQLSLPKSGASTEEILLHRRQLATQFQYFTSIGLSYTFGSIYNNVVNPRFGN